jgi:hypothetical protein
LSTLTALAGVPWLANLLDDMLEAAASAERIGRPPATDPTHPLVSANRRHVASTDVGAVRDLSRTLRRLDNQFGGGLPTR